MLNFGLEAFVLAGANLLGIYLTGEKHMLYKRDDKNGFWYRVVPYYS